MSGHTPGPLTIDGYSIVQDLGREGVYTVADMNTAHPFRAEYQLMFAAAPETAAELERVRKIKADLVEELEEARTDLMIAAENALHAEKTDPRWEGVYGKLMRRVEQCDAAIARASHDGGERDDPRDAVREIDGPDGWSDPDEGAR